MPLYEYICPAGHRTEVLARLGDPAPASCPHCEDESPVARTLFAPAIHFKGTGFHNTDNASNRPRSGALG
ncbi:FmdB family zinc ribbon protein [Miltoncostaea oceani]|uniref:FmdB family zinc ribbon protein n=1 Tax=Miltoncostaea oceani TaxID=2843216 RepID=UPI001C3D3C3C|nr:zinc ribbon domain-containing protein [Miltoncostaea oceani]